MITLDKIYHAAYVLKNVTRNTDLIYSSDLNPDCEIYLKTENLQVTGSFKTRGAYYKISQLSQAERDAGVIACSAGNHAQGVALAAQKENIKAVICIPDGAPISKVEATKRYGAEVVLVKGVYDDAYARAKEIEREEGLTFIHPFDDVDIIAGQGTVGLEVLDQLPDVDAIIVPIGGGGLISGIAFAAKKLNPKCKIYGVQALGSPSMYNSINHNQIETLDNVATIADGIAVKRPGEITYSICSEYVDEIATVTEDEISTAILTLIEQRKIVTEGAGAVAVAAAMFNKFDIKGKKVVCILSGGNIDVTILSRVINRGLLKSGRILELKIEIADKPGQLNSILDIIAKLGGNIVTINHNRATEDITVIGCELNITLETRDKEHIKQIRSAILSAGFIIK